MKTITHTLEVLSNNDIRISKEPKKPKNLLGTFQAIGETNHMFTGKQEKYDIFDALDKVNKGAYSLFNQLKNNRNPYTCRTVMPIPKGETASQKTSRNRWARELVKIGIIKKVKTSPTIPKNSWMINPEFIKSKDNQTLALHEWVMLK